MKKFICTVLTLALTFSTVVTSFAIDERLYDIDTSEMTEEEVKDLQEFIRKEEMADEIQKNMEPSIDSILDETLSKDDYAGKYVVDGVLHIMTVDKESTEKPVQKALMNARGKTREAQNVVIDDTPAKYTLQELYDASDNIFKTWGEGKNLHIKTISIEQKENTLELLSPEWTDERKQEIMEFTGLDNIIFSDGDSVEIIENQFLVPSSSEEAPKPKSPVIARAGSRIMDKDYVGPNGGYHTSTLTCSVKGNDTGWVTTGHSQGSRGIETGDIFKCEDIYTLAEDNMGPVKRVLWDDKFDCTFIRYTEQNSDAYRSKTTKYDLPIVSSGTPTKDNYVYILGNSTLSKAMVTSESLATGWNGKPVQQLIQMKIVGGYDAPIEGDSGSAVCEITPDQQGYKLVGIYKGTRNDGYYYATRWDNVKEELGIDVY